jgi:hypothetical protein
MKILLYVYLLFIISNHCLAQQSEEAEIRKLENLEREAILKGDTTLLRKMMSPQIVVHNPENTIVTFDKIIARVKTGKIDYASFERVIEKVTFIDEMAVVMGHEIIQPQGSTTNAGKTVTRRFTNIWLKESDGWKLTARQATIISVK